MHNIKIHKFHILTGEGTGEIELQMELTKQMQIHRQTEASEPPAGTSNWNYQRSVKKYFTIYC